MPEEISVVKRLEKLREYVKLLGELSKTPRDRFVEDPFVRGNVERYLQLAIQSCLDIGNHILARERVAPPEQYRDVFQLLGKEKLIPEELAARMAPLAGLRNILVHGYLEVDLGQVYDMLQTQLSDFADFAKSVGSYLDAGAG